MTYATGRKENGQYNYYKLTNMGKRIEYLRFYFLAHEKRILEFKEST